MTEKTPNHIHDKFFIKMHEQKTKSEISVKQESFLTVIPRTPIMKPIYWF